MDLEIRSAEPGDLTGLLQLYPHLNPTDDPLPDSANVEHLWATMLNQPGFSSGGA